MLDIINRLSNADIHIYLENGKLKTRSSRQSMNEEFKSIIQNNKTQLIDYLKTVDLDVGLLRGKHLTFEKSPNDIAQIPLSFSQKRLWFIDRLGGGSPEYNILIALPVDKTFNVDIAERAINQIIQRHQILRTIYKEGDVEPEQIVRNEFNFEITCFDLSNLSKEEQSAKTKSIKIHEENKIFNLEDDLMIRVVHIRLSKNQAENEGVLLVNMHHIASDGWSMNIFLNEFKLLYGNILNDNTLTLPLLDIQYKDFAIWQNKWLAGDVIENQLSYWKKTLENVPAVHSLPLDYCRRDEISNAGALITEILSPELCYKLICLARDLAITPFMLLHATLAIVLSRHSNTHDIVIGTPVANRMQKQVEPLIGFFVNTLVLRCNTEFDTFRSFIEHIKEVNLNAQDNQDVPFESLVEISRVPRNTQHLPLVQIVLSMNTNKTTGKKKSTAKAGTSFLNHGTAKFELLVNADLNADEGNISWNYNTTLFARERIEKLNSHLLNLLLEITENHDCAMRDLSMLSKKEELFLVRDINQRKNEITQNSLIHQLFEVQANINSSAVALSLKSFNGCYEHLSYKKLDEQSNQVANYLIAIKGVKNGSLIGLCFKHSLDLVVSILGILKAGCAYVPLDPECPQDRLTYMINDAGLDIVLTHLPVKEKMECIESYALCLDESKIRQQIHCQDKNNPFNKNGLIDCNSLAYVMYTSGSTGKPKGVMVTHKNVVALVSDNKYVNLEAGDVLAQIANISFDAATFEIWGAICNGARLFHIPKYTLLSAEDFELALTLNSVSVMFLTSALFNQIVSHRPSCFHQLKSLLIGGEQANYECVRKFQKMGYATRLINVYGPTEATTFSLYKTLKIVESYKANNIPIGRTLKFGTAYILDRNGSLAPFGCVGELCLGGERIAKGYLNNQELTAERFFIKRFSDGSTERLYKSGDLARYLENGDVEYLGRFDEQVKIRGFRVELGEIDNHLSAIKYVNSSVVTVVESESGEKKIAAYIKLDNNDFLKDSELLTYIRVNLNSKLPHYMIPSHFIFVEQWPITINGKLDKKALPAPDNSLFQKEYVEPVSETERSLVAIWAKLLEIDFQAISVTSNFFDLGGHSLLTVRLVFEIRHKFNKEISIKSIFDSMDIRKLAAILDGSVELEETRRIKSIKKQGDLKLSFAQERLWFIDQLEKGSPEYNIPFSVPVNQDFDADIAEKVFEKIIQRHESLRTVFADTENGPVQIVLDEFDFKISRYDLSDLETTEKPIRAKALVQQEKLKVFDLSKDLMLRSCFIKLSDDDVSSEGILLYTMHHIASDGWSMDIFSREFSTLYQAFIDNKPDPLPALEIQYADFAQWQREWLTGEILEQQLSYWDQQLRDIPVVHSLPLDFPRPAMKSHVGAIISESLSPALASQLLTVSRDLGVTPFMLLHGALGLVLSFHSGSTDIVIGTPVANRTQIETESLIGFFVNTLVLRVNTDYIGFGEYMNHVKAINLDAQVNQDVPFENLVERFQLPRSIQHTPLFQIMLTMNQQAMAPQKRKTKTGIQFSTNHVIKFDLSVSAALSEQGGMIAWEYDVTLFSRQHIEYMNIHLNNLLSSIVKNPNIPLSELHLLSKRESSYLIHDLNRTAVAHSGAPLIHQLIEQRAIASPDAIALIFNHERLTYRTLNERANQFAHYLVSQGVGPEILVGVCFARTLDLVIAIIGILKSGGAYVPLDPSYPEKRLQYIIDDSGVNLVIVDSTVMGRDDALANQLLSSTQRDIKLIQLDLILQTKSLPKTNPDNLARSTNLAYIIYTSGSTGAPKGVAIQHGSAVSLLSWASRLLSAEESRTVLASTSICFDLSIYELFLPLSLGAQCCLVDSILSLKQHPMQSHITLVNTVPSAASALLNDNALAHSIRVINLAGEPLSQELVNRLYQSSRVKKVYDLYGPSESTTYSTFTLRLLDGKANIGRPIDNTQTYILDSLDRLVPQGVIGELYIGGSGLSRGYLKKASATAVKFIPNHLSQNPGERLYRTGDLVRYLADGELEFIGRIDHQVKIRGFRIEPGEIESVLLRYEPISEAVVLVQGTLRESQRLVAFVVKHQTRHGVEQTESTEEAVLFVKAIQEYLSKQLPAYMQPSSIVPIQAIPLTANGKVDRKALALFDTLEAVNQQYIKPTTHTEKTIIKIVAQLLNLNVDRISVSANFFELGGHSLLAVRLVAAIRSQLDKEISIKSVFEHANIHRLSHFIEQASNVSIRPVIKPIERNGSEMLPSFAQQRLWFIDQLGDGSPEYNMPTVVPIEGDFNIDAAEQAFAQIVQRHEVLRTVFAEGKNGPVQVIKNNVEFKLCRLDLSNIKDSEQIDQVKQIVKNESSKTFDLSNDLMLRGTYINLSNDTDKPHGILIFTLHHIASDGWSMRVLSNEFDVLYQALIEGKKMALPPLAIQYADYAHSQKEWFASGALEKQLEYWDRKLLDLPLEHSIPLDHERPAIKTHKGAIISESLSAQLCTDIIDKSKLLSITPYMLLHATIALLISRHSNSNDIVIGTPVANRMQVEVEPLIGCFVNSLVLRTRTDFNDFEEYINHVKEVNLDAQENQDVPFEKLVERCLAHRNTQVTPLFQIMFSMNESREYDKPLKKNNGKYVSNKAVAKYDLSIDIDVAASGGNVAWTFDSAIFSQAHIEKLNDHFKRILNYVLNSSHSKLSEIEILSDEEIKYLIDTFNQNDFNQNNIDSQHDILCYELFQQQALLNPHKTAVSFASVHISYQELNRRSSQLAHYLMAKGVKANSLVGICVDRSIELIVGILGILKAGGAYIPLDPNYPYDTLMNMLQDSGARILISKSNSTNHFKNICDIEIIEIDSMQCQTKHAELSQEYICRQKCNHTSEQLAYVMYTSGTTGKSKGVKISHKNIIAYFNSAKLTYNLKSDDRILQFSSLSFDIFVEEMFCALLSGASMVFRNEEVLLGDYHFWDFINRYQITVTSLPTAFWHEICVHLNNQLLSTGMLRLLIIGGESMSIAMLNRWLSSLEDKVRLINTYGPTEATVIATAFDLTNYQYNHRSIPIGKPLPNTQVYILNNNMGLCPIGVYGELYIGGDSVALGYLHHSKLTSEKFLPNKFSNNSSGFLYKTGDIARIAYDGNLEFNGRMDQQVKLNGFRIEIEAVEYCLLECEAVSSCVVTVSQGNHGRKTLVAYYVAEKSSVDLHSETKLMSILRDHLQTRLPIYMTPSVFIRLEEIPLTKNGKVDKPSLPKHEAYESTVPYAAPRTQIEWWLCEMWQDIFDVNLVGIHDNFFELGGHSLLTVKLAAKIKEKLGINVKIYDFFKNQTIYSLAKNLLEQQSTNEKDTIVKVNVKGSEPPIFLIPGLGGSSHIFYELTQSLGHDNPIYGLDQRGISGCETPHANIQDIARYNVSCIREINPDGPYVFVAHSMGASIALEMTRILNADEKQRTKLIILDGSPALTPSYYNQIKKMIPENVGAGLVNMITIQATMSYEPNNIKHDDILIIQAKNNNQELYKEWKKISNGRFEHRLVAGDHFSILKKPSSVLLGTIIRQSLFELKK